MSDLVKRLREDQPVTQDMESTIQCSLQDEAADRIEELEANLAKAVEALGRIADDCEADYPPSHGAIKHDARTTLAELTGGKDDN